MQFRKIKQYLDPGGRKILKCVSDKQISAAARSKAWVCGRSLAGIAGSNPTEGMDVCRL
jgi:hypothetical protein